MIDEERMKELLRPYIDSDKADDYDKIKELIDKIGRMTCKTCIAIRKIINE